MQRGDRAADGRRRRLLAASVRRLPWVVVAAVVVVLSITTAARPGGGTSDAAPSTSDSAATTGTPATSTPTPTSATAVPEWTPLIDQTFDTPAALGSFDTVYPGWADYDGYHDTDGYGLYDSDRVVSVADGLLTEHLHTAGGEPLVVSVTPVPHVQTYGRYEVRFRSDEMPSYKIAWLLWPADNNWDNGEIDFPEAGLGAGDVIEGFSHPTNSDEGNYGWSVTTDQDASAWHSAVIEWRPDSVTFILDGVVYRNTAPGSIPNVPMYWSMQTEADDPAAWTAGDLQIDYVRAWAYTGPGSTVATATTTTSPASTLPTTTGAVSTG